MMPALHSAAISAKLLQQLGGGTVIGPVLCGLAHSAQIVQTGATVSEIVTAAALGRPRRQCRAADPLTSSGNSLQFYDNYKNMTRIEVAPGRGKVYS